MHINKYINENKQIDIKIILAPRSGHEGRECMVEACSSWLWHWEHVTLTVHMTWDQEAKSCSQELHVCGLMSVSYAAACPHSSQPHDSAASWRSVQLHGPAWDVSRLN